MTGRPWLGGDGGGLRAVPLAVFSCARAGMALRLPRPRLTPEVNGCAVMPPGVFGAGVTQLNLLISTAIASLLPAGAVSYLYYADRLNQLPLGVVGIAVGTAILPSLSRQVRSATKRRDATQNRGLELALLLTLPAAVGLGVLGAPILAGPVRARRLRPAEAAATAAALAAYAAGLPAFVLVQGAGAGVFRPPGHGDPGEDRDVGAMAVNSC